MKHFAPKLCLKVSVNLDFLEFVNPWPLIQVPVS